MSRDPWPKVALLTREYPPEVYGGAGVHVEYLAHELRRLVDLGIQCWGRPRDEPGVLAHESWAALAEPKPEALALQAMSIELAMVGPVKGAHLVHSHTWYANLAGHWAKLAWGIPHVLTSHSLEPLRPWKREQLGGGYELSTYAERTATLGADAVIAVSEGSRRDLIGSYPDVDPARVHVIHNGVDPVAYQRRPAADILDRYGVDQSRPYAIWLGRVTRQKGLQHLLAAALQLPRGSQLVICAGAPDTPEIAAEVEGLAERVRTEVGGLVWIEGILPREHAVNLYSGASVFVCPSIYEPFGLVNLEAMACQVAVVASAVGGIPEIVVEGETGYLVAYDESDPGAFEAGLGRRVGELLADPGLAARMGRAGRQRVLDHFSWAAIAERTVELYRELTG
ncbi:MAG: glycogen synthase [Candidatus Dormibacteraeota bacterium]|nr:glycogen synthase [Candidatus Dormibacteraeota bacterium]